jgi:hypothetical protein
MITETKTNVIQRKGVKSEGKFQIKATGKAFRILSDGLYSDKIKAIMRELACNAYDAHVDAGHLDKPFDIHIPNRLEPHFNIRDYGIGLSHDDVVNVYTTYFESTKTESNDYIGCLGLGSKSPFSYVDNFSIVSYFNGEKRIYNAFLNEDETPTIALLSESKTDEPNGLEVSFPVQGNDASRFEEKARDVFTYFKMRPNFTGAKIEVTDVKYVLEGSNWGVRETRYGGHAKAVMGNVAYSLNDFSGDTKDIDKAVLSLIKLVPIDVVFDIGDLEVAASRESLSYNKRTIANINRVLGEVVKEIRKKASEKIAHSKNLWEARVLAHEIKTGEYSHLKTILEGQNIFEWNGLKLDGGSYVKFDDALRAREIPVLCFAPKTSYRRRRVSNDPTISHEYTNIIHTTKSTRIFWADINRGSHLRCKQVIVDSESQSSQDYYGNVEKAIDKVYLIQGSKSDVEAIRQFLGIDDIPPISSIEKQKESKVYKQSEYNPKNATRILVYEKDTNKHNWRKPASQWKKENVDLDAGGIYVNISRYKIGDDDAHAYISRMEGLLEPINDNLNDVTIVGVKDSALIKFEAHKGWMTLRDYVKGLIVSYINDNDLENKIAIANAMNMFHTHQSYLQKMIMTIDLDMNKPCGKFVEKVKVMEKATVSKEQVAEMLKLQRAASKVGVELKLDGNKIDLDAEWEKVCEHYPLFEEIDGWGIQDKKEGVVEYIKALDRIK